MKFRAKLRLVERQDASIGAEIITPEVLGAEVVGDRGLLDAAGYLNDQQITLTNFIHDGLRRGFPAVIVHIPRAGEGIYIVERPLDLSAGSKERALTERLVDQEGVEFRWVNERVTIRKAFHPGLREWWRRTLKETAGTSPEQWMALLVSFRREFSEWPAGARPPMRPKRRLAPAPATPVPFFARRSGAIPRSGRPTVAGVRLPKGTRHPAFAPAYWVSDDRVSDAVGLAAEIAQSFPQVGVWPLLWLYDEDPEAYMAQPGDAGLIDDVDLEVLLRDRWQSLSLRYPGNESIFGTTPPRLADGSPLVPAPASRPFERLPADTEARLLLVPSNRPADAITVIGGLDAEMTGPEISAVLRSWEERFGATPVAVQPSLAWLGVASPPRSLDQAARLAAEFNVVSPLPPESQTETLADVAAAMTKDQPRPPTLDIRLRAHLWPIGSYD
jgi:Domain of unknown function (DUF4253)